MFRFFKNIGPGPLVAAAFIGPGTVTVCTLAGVYHGYSLLWALGFSVIATIILQEMAARLGVISQKGLAENLNSHISHPILRTVLLFMVLSAIVIGNAAYEAGNISGAALGLDTLFGFEKLLVSQIEIDINVLIIGIIGFFALYVGNYRFIERFLIFLVGIMSFAFVSTALLTSPNWSQVFSGLLIPKFEANNLLTVIALIGTTVVPYNLFLHASLASTKWKYVTDLKFARRDTFIAIVLGGLVSMSIVIAATGMSLNEITGATDLAVGLEPLLGSTAKYVIAIGLFAAGITSAITAPLAAAYVASGCLGWALDIKSKSFRLVWMIILILGVIFSMLNYSPIIIIKLAQIANGFVLPIVAIFLILTMNNSKILGKHINSKFQNFLGVAIVILTIVLGTKGIFSVIDSW